MSTETEEDAELSRNVDTNPVTTNSQSSDVAPLPRKPSIEERLASKMCTLFNQILSVFFGVTFTLIFGALHSESPKISMSPPAHPFFNQSSVILDFYKGQLGALIDRTSFADVSFVMYYAPWDAESQDVRHEFERVAQHYQSQVFFGAINCWHPKSECKNQYNKVASYPIFILYPQRGPGVMYRGIKSAAYMMRFIAGFLKPYHRISTREELRELLIEKDAVFVGFFHFRGLEKSRGFKEFYKASIMALEKDPNQDVAFAVVTSAKTALMEFAIMETPAASLYLWNKTLSYPQEKIWSARHILHWLDGSVIKVSQWLQPPGVKSSTLAPYSRGGPMLILFTPRNPLRTSNSNYDLLKEVALEYQSCGNAPYADRMIERLQLKRINAAGHYTKKRKQCSELLVDARMQQAPPLHVGISIQHWINESCCAKVFINKCLLCEREDAPSSGVCHVSAERLHEFCNSRDVFDVADRKKGSTDEHFCCKTYQHSHETSREFTYDTSQYDPEDDSRSSRAIKKQKIVEDCLKFLAGEAYHDPIFVQASLEDVDAKLSVSTCRINRTIAFIAIDSLHYVHFTEALGINISSMKDKTAVVILDSLKESQYLMPGSLRRKSLVDFLNNFANGTVHRTLRSNNFKRLPVEPQVASMCNGDSLTVCIPELNTHTFKDVVIDATKDVVVMYYSPYCAFCSAVSHVFLTIARLLSHVDGILFARIDGDNNDLPWEYSMARYPSILFFPAKKKEDSTIFSSLLPINIPNLLNFVLANLEEDTRVQALVNICHIGSGESPADCVARVRRVCLDIIQNYLRSYRKLRLSKTRIAGRKVREVLFKLEHIRDIHLVLSTINDLSETISYQIVIAKFRKYRDNLRHIARQKSHKIRRSRTKDEL